MARVSLHFRFSLVHTTIIVSLLTSPASAESSKVPRRVTEVMAEAQGVATSLQRQLTPTYDRFLALKAAAATLLSQKSKSLDIIRKDRESALAVIDGQLDQGINELFAVTSQISIIPEVTTFTESLVNMTGAFQEQSSLVIGPETLRCGSSCEYYQERRNAISLILQGLKADIGNVKEILAVQRQKVIDFSKELASLQKTFDLPIAQFGLRHYLDLKDQLLLNQKLIIDDVSQISLRQNLDGEVARINAPCSGGGYTYASLLDDVNSLWSVTAPWGNGISDPVLASKYTISAWSGGSKDAPGPFKALKNQYDGWTDSQGMYTPGWLDNWQGCIGTKRNIINDLKKKVATELSLGNKGAAQQLDLQTNTLQVEVDRLEMQLRRIKQANGLLDLLLGMGKAIAPAPKAGELPLDIWKDAVYAGIADLSRTMVVTRQVLLAARDLTELALSSAAPLKAVSDLDNNARDLLYSVQKRLEALGQQGFGRLELELDSAADSLGTMSANIKGLEGVAGEGGLAEAISTYHTIVSIRGNQMRFERDSELPQRLKEAEWQVQKLEGERGTTFGLLNSVLQTIRLLREYDDKLEERLDRLGDFFAPKTAHPLYAVILSRYLSDLKPDKVTEKLLKREINKLLGKVKTTETKFTSSRRGGSTSDPLVKKARSLKKRYERAMPALMAGETVSLLGMQSIVELLDEIEALHTATSAL